MEKEKSIPWAIAIDIPVKPYIKAYIIHRNEGDIIYLRKSNHDIVSQKLFELMSCGTNHHRTIAKCDYEEKLKVYISRELAKSKAQNLNHSNIRSFNRFFELLIKQHLCSEMNYFCSVLPNFSENIPEVRRRLGICSLSWSDEAIKKVYYRHRMKRGLPLLPKGSNLEIGPL